MKVFLLPIVLGLLATSLDLTAQNNGSLLLISDFKAHLMLDGEDKGTIEANKPQKFELIKGQHYVQLFHSELGTERSSLIEIKQGKQIVHKVAFLANPEDLFGSNVLVVEGQLDIPGIALGEGETGSTIYHAFEKGDEILLDFDLINRNGKCAVTVFTYPDNSVKYSSGNFKKLDNVSIKVRERSIYGFTFTTTNLLNRKGQITIRRKSESGSTKNFNTEVSFEEVIKPILVQDLQEFYVNGGGKSTFFDGKSRVVLPITLPLNTIKWYYRFSSNRDKTSLESTSNAMDLIGELTRIIDKTGILALGVDLLTTPPGSNYSDIYLIDRASMNPFLSKGDYSHYPQGTRENFMSGNVEIDCCISGEFYLGFKNPDPLFGINISIEVVAITSTYELRMKDN